MMTGVRELLAGWKEGLLRGVIALPRCDQCGAWNWYPRTMCPVCGCHRRSLVEVRPEGVIYAWTRIHRALPPVQHMPVPYLVATVELADARGTRVVCRADEPLREPVAGESVKLVIDREDAANPFLKFRYPA